MGKSSGSTRASSAGSPKGLAATGGGRMNYSIPIGVGGPAILGEIDRKFANISNLLTDRDVSQEYNLGDGFMARITVTSLPTGNNQATLGVYDGEDLIGSQRIVYNPIREDEVMQANEDFRDKIITEIVKNRK